jgi:hypothetical protein
MDEQAYRDFAEKHNLKMQVTKLGFNKDKEWPHFAFDITLSKDDRTLNIQWSCGEGFPMSDPAVIAKARLGNINRYTAEYRSYGRLTFDQLAVNRIFHRAALAVFEPSIVEILGSLKLDLSCVYYDGIGFVVAFEDFCREIGYDTDSRKAEKIYRACMEQSQCLVRMLGIEATSELLDLEYL